MHSFTTDAAKSAWPGCNRTKEERQRGKREREREREQEEGSTIVEAIDMRFRFSQETQQVPNNQCTERIVFTRKHAIYLACTKLTIICTCADHGCGQVGKWGGLCPSVRAFIRSFVHTVIVHLFIQTERPNRYEETAEGIFNVNTITGTSSVNNSSII